MAPASREESQRIHACKSGFYTFPLLRWAMSQPFSSVAVFIDTARRRTEVPRQSEKKFSNREAKSMNHSKECGCAGSIVIRGWLRAVTRSPPGVNSRFALP
jgi:hypothetical protein